MPFPCTNLRGEPLLDLLFLLEGLHEGGLEAVGVLLLEAALDIGGDAGVTHHAHIRGT